MLEDVLHGLVHTLKYVYSLKSPTIPPSALAPLSPTR